MKSRIMLSAALCVACLAGRAQSRDYTDGVFIVNEDCPRS